MAMIMKYIRAAVLLPALLLCAHIAHAQGNTVQLQTVTATVANAATCTGAAQNFRTNQNIAGFINIGQTHHLATATSTAASFTMEIDGLDNAGNPFRLSDIQVGVPSSAQGGLVVEARGYMANIQIKVTCTAAATFTLSYSGDYSTSPATNSAALLAATDKLPFQTAAANTTVSTTFQSPTGNSSGTIVFQYAAAGPAGSTIAVQCLSNAGVSLQAFNFTPTTGTGAQLFPVNSSTCPFVTLTYTSGGASATTYNMEYVFNPIGAQNTTNDPCNSGALKLSAPISIASATTTQIITPVVNQKIYPCGVMLTMNSNASSRHSFQWISGTGATCGTGTTTLSGPIDQESAEGNNSFGFSGNTFLNLSVGQGLCIVTVQGAGANINDAGVISYVQQ